MLFSGIDLLDGVQVINGKSHVAGLDQRNASRFGRFEEKSPKAAGRRSDARFT